MKMVMIEELLKYAKQRKVQVDIEGGGDNVIHLTAHNRLFGGRDGSHTTSVGGQTMIDSYQNAYAELHWLTDCIGCDNEDFCQPPISAEELVQMWKGL